MLACSPIESGGEDRSATSANSAIIDRQFLEPNKIKSVDHRKLLANEKFEKIGHLPLSNMVGQMKPLQSAEQSEDKLPVLEMMPGGGFDSDMSYGGSVGGGAGSGEYQRPCNCTKSYCLKLYCECFARDKLCVNCNCSNCMNNVGHEKSRSTALLRILDKNPLAFLPKIGATSVGAGGLRHKLHRKGCNCKRSECLKNYCECREAKIECSLLCRCQGCKNRSSELNSYSSQPPCTLDMAMLDSNGFKNPSLFKSNHIIDPDKPPENVSNDLNYPFTNIYDDANMNPPNIYCNETAMPEFGPPINYPPVSNTMDDLIKMNENYKKISENFYKQSSQQSLPQSEDILLNSKPPHMMNWNSFINANPNTVDYKPLPSHNPYNMLNYSKFSNHHHRHYPYPSSFSSDLDENSIRMPPPSAFQYYNDSDEFLDMPSINYFKSFNPVANMKHFDNGNHYQYPLHINTSQSLNVHSSEKVEQNDNSEVTSTNEIEPNAVLVSSNCDSLTQHSSLGDNASIKPSSCDSHSPLCLTVNENFNCFPFATDSVFSNGSKSSYARKFSNQSQMLNGHVLPSLFHNDCDNTEINSRMPYFCHGNIPPAQMIPVNRNSPSIIHRKSNHDSAEDNISSRFSTNPNFINSSTPNFYNFYNESDSSFINSGVSMDGEDLMHKSEPLTSSDLNNSSIYPDNFNPFFYGNKNDIYSKIVPCNSNPHR